MRKITLILSFLIVSFLSFAQKQPIGHDVYDSWKSIRNITAPQNGNVLLYYITPQEGDNLLNIYNTQTDKLISVPRASNAVLSEDKAKVIAIIKPLFEQTREAKIKKKKGDEMPKDTLAIIDLHDGKITKIPNYKSHNTPKIIGNYIAFQESSDKDLLNNVYVYNIYSKKIDTLKNVDSYRFIQDGSALIYTTKYVDNSKNRANVKKGAKDTTLLAKFGFVDTVDTFPGIYMYSFPLRTNHEILQGPKGSTFKLPSQAYNKLAFYANLDTTKAGQNNSSIYLYDIPSNKLQEIVTTKTQGVPQEWVINTSDILAFSQNGERLFFGISPKPREKDTTLVDFEQPQLDIWSWHDEYNQPQQLVNISRDRNKSYEAYITLNNPTQAVLLGDEIANHMTIPANGNSNLALISSNKNYRYQTQWNSDTPRDIYIMNVNNGQKELVFKEVNYNIGTPSPSGRYYPIFNSKDGNWYIYDINTKDLTNITKPLSYTFWNEEHDTPSLPGSYGRPIWLEDESGVLIPDKYDIWQFSPNKKYEPYRITNGIGRENNTTFRLTNPYDNSRKFSLQDITYSDMGAISPLAPLYFTTFNHTTKENGYYLKEHLKKGSKLTKLTESGNAYSNLVLSGSKSPLLYYTKGNFNNPMDLWETKDKFKSEKKLTDINPQQRDYNWGDVKLVDWTTEDGIKAEGLLFTPRSEERRVGKEC